MLYYTVRWKSQTPPSNFTSNCIKANFPNLLLQFFEKVVHWVAPQFIQPLGNIIEPRGAFHDPVNISCKVLQQFFVYILNNSFIYIIFRCNRYKWKGRIAIFGGLRKRQPWIGHIIWNHCTQPPRPCKWIFWKTCTFEMNKFR